MKILYVAVFSSTSTNNSQARALKKAGADVIEYNYRVKAKELGSNELRDADILNEVKERCPDLVLFSKCNGVSNTVISTLNKYTETALWFMDAARHWNPELEKKIRECTYVFCAKKNTYELALKLRSSNTFHVCEGFDSNYDKPPISPVEQDLPITFIGAMHSDRSRWKRKVNFTIFTGQYGADHATIVHRSKINLNFCSESGESDRVYKVMAAGGFLLTDPWDGMETQFCAGTHLDIFHDETELKEKTEYYLSHPEKAQDIAARGLRRVQRYSRESWAHCIIEKKDNVV